MKILRIVYDWPKPWSGLAPHPYEITKSQVKAGHEIEIFVGLWPKSGVEEIKGVKINTIYREPVRGSIFFTSSIALFYRYYKWRKSNRPDIIHMHGHFGIWILLYRKFLKKFFPWSDELKIPLVTHFHRTAKGRWKKLEDEESYILPHSKFVQWPLEVFADKLAVETSAACIFVSNSNLEEAVEFYGLNRNKAFVIESGVNPELFYNIGQEEREKSRADMGLDIYDKVILNNGMMVERKNIHLLVESMKYLPQNYKLLLVGPSDESYSEKLWEIARQNKIENKIVKVGYTPYPQVPIAFQIADIFVLPSEWEGMPKVVMQSLATGVPALVSGFRLSVDISGLVYLDDLDPKNIAAKIQEIIENPPAVDSRTTINLFSWDQRALEIEKVYDYAKTHYL